MALRDWLFGNRASTASRLVRHPVPGRVSGPPQSSNGASSFHLWLQIDPRPMTSFSATIEILEPPRVGRLFFWALQVSFLKGSTPVGAGHIGLQHYSKHPNSAAVNWGGYDSSGRVLAGSLSELASAAGNPNTRDYQWWPNRRYEYRISRSELSGWRGTITDLSTGVETIIRDLLVEADGLGTPVVWTEAFAYCDEPGVAVRWSNFRGTRSDGALVRPSHGRVSYQSLADGGCTNTTFELAPSAVIQRTNTQRTIESGQVLRLG